MIRYHQIMQYVYILTSVGILIYTTYLGIEGGFGKIWGMYLFILATIMQFFRHRRQVRKLKTYYKEQSQQ